MLRRCQSTPACSAWREACASHFPLEPGRLPAPLQPHCDLPVPAESPLSCLVNRQGERLVCTDLAQRRWVWSTYPPASTFLVDGFLSWKGLGEL